MTEAPDFGSRRDFYTFAPETLAQQLPQFEILREVGKGSMGIVYEARVRATGGRIALKILPPSLTLTERALARFLREGRIMARVRHPDIVAFVDQGAAGRLHWFAMEFVDGTTLEERLKVGPLPVQKACAIAAAVGRALQFAHDRGVVHRDLKPGNLMLRDVEVASAFASGGGQASGSGSASGDVPRVAITDFGLARETGTGSMTESGAIVGTPMYMPPERVLGGTGAANTLGDVYGLGATLYALVTGHPPFDGPTAQSVLKAVLEQDPRPAHRLRADLPPAVSAVVQKAMERDPARRYGSTLELAEDLERFLRGERVLARRPGPLALFGRWVARHRLIAVLLTLVVALSIGAVVLVRERNRSALERSLAEAERLLAIAATSRDEQDRLRTPADRHDLLLAAVAAASATIARDEGFAMAWLVRARAHHRLGHWEEAIYDLDTVERLTGTVSADLLHLRISALRQQGQVAAVRRLQQDLTSLLQIDPSAHTRALVADYLLDLAAQAGDRERQEALAAAREVLAEADDDPRAQVARARLLESEGEIEPALAAMRKAAQEHGGNLYVHLQAAAMFDRQDLLDEGAQEHERARRLGGEQGAATTAGEPPAAQPIDLDGLGHFLDDVDRLLRALDAPTPPATPDGGTANDGKPGIGKATAPTDPPK